MIRPTPSSVHFPVVDEVYHPGEPGFWRQPEWGSQLPWVTQGTTGAPPGASMGGRDLALFGAYSAPEARNEWKRLGSSLGFHSVVASPQVHGSGILHHGGVLHRGDDGRETGTGVTLRLAPEGDGHLTSQSGILMGVTVADCTPVFLADPRERSVGLLHAGWRGVAAGIVERGLERMMDRFGCVPGELYVHLGPAICGKCYEVGPEVFSAVGLPEPKHPTPLDLRKLIAERAHAVGVREERISISSWCTLCAGSPFFSHRGGDRGRQVGFLGIRG